MSVLFADTGDYLRISDPKDVAGQRAWERATDAAIAFAQNPGEAAGAKLLALVGEDSSLGDPTEESFLERLSVSQRVVALEQLAHAAATAHHLAGRNADGSRNPSIDGVVTMTPQGQALVSRPVGKAATADALRVAATQAGLRRGEDAAQAVTAGKASLADEVSSLRAAASLAGPQRPELLAQAHVAEQQAADLAKAAAVRASGRRRTWGQVVMQRRLDVGPTATQRRIATQRAESLAKAAGADEWDGPPFLEKAGGRGRA